MLSDDKYADVVARIRKIHRITRRLSRLPAHRLDVDVETAQDAAYINEWLDIILCRICRQAAVEMPPLSDDPEPLLLYQHCMKKAYLQARRIRWRLSTGQIDRSLLTDDAWSGIDSVESMLLCSSMGAVQPRRWHR